MKSIFFKKAQSLTEISLVIAVVSLVFIGMEFYIKRGFQGKIKDLTDYSIGSTQKTYSVDVAGLEVNTANTEISFNSERQDATLTGGGKTLITQQNQIINSRSDSADTN